MADEATTPAPPGSSLWILSLGSRGDFQPYVALGLGLQSAGHHVKVFGLQASEAFFTSYELPFEATDADLFWRNPQACEWLGGMAARCNLGSIEDAYLQLCVLKHEYRHWLAMELCSFGRTIEDVMCTCEGFCAQFELIDTDTDCDLIAYSSFIESKLIECTFWQAQFTGVSAEEWKTQRDDRCRAYLELVKGLSEESGRSPSSVIECLNESFRQYCVSTLSGSDPGNAPRLLAECIGDFVSWQTGDNLQKYWAVWAPRLGWPQQQENAEGDAFGRFSIIMNNVLRAADSTAFPPALVIHNSLMTGVAMALRNRHGWPLLHAVTSPVPFQIETAMGLYVLLVSLEHAGRERPWGPSPSPVEDAGPMVVSDLLRGLRQIVGMSPLRLTAELVPQEARGDEQWLATARSRFTGSWVLEADQQLSPDSPRPFGGSDAREQVEEFLAAGAGVAPVYFGWGPMRHPQGADELLRLVVRTLQILGRRGIFVVDSQQPLGDSAPGELLVLRAAPHEWLFPLCACTVHHGGANTTSAGLRAGVPAIVVPVASDQPSNGAWVADMGCGAMTKLLGEVTAEELAGVIGVVLDNKAVAGRIKEVSAALRRDPGVPAAVELVEQCIQKGAKARYSDLHAWSPQRLLLAGVGERASRPWRDGMHVHLDGKGQLVGRTAVRGNLGFSPEGSSEKPVLWLRAGSFQDEDKTGLKVGQSHYHVRAFMGLGTLSHHGHFNVCNHGRVWEWADGSKSVLVAM